LAAIVRKTQKHDELNSRERWSIHSSEEHLNEKLRMSFKKKITVRVTTATIKKKF
jgi:hypothetical protein